MQVFSLLSFLGESLDITVCLVLFVVIFNGLPVEPVAR
jgi:hypothetical protein